MSISEPCLKSPLALEPNTLNVQLLYLSITDFIFSKEISVNPILHIFPLYLYALTII